MTMKLKNTTLTLFSLGLSSLVLFSCGDRKNANQSAATPPPTAVTVAAVQQESVTGIDSYPGSMAALNETELRAEVSGYITNIFVGDGASVTKGQRLYEIDRTRYTAAEEQARANLAIAEANADRLKRDLDRYQTLASQDAIAKQTLDYATTDYANAQAQVLVAKAALTTATTNLDRSIITAPFSGTIGISQVRMGALVNPGTTLINTISSTSPIAVDFAISEREIQRFTNLQKSTAKDSLISLLLPDGTAYPHPGKIVAIDRAVDRTTGTILVRASFSNPDGALRAGMNTSIRLLNQSEELQLTIPYKAVTEQLGESSVFVLTDSSTVSQRGIQLGLKYDDRVVVTSGLEVGEKVVTDGVINIRHGAKVNAQQP